MIKSNIDLTANEIFSRNVHRIEIVKSLLYDKFPWVSIIGEPITSDSDLLPKYEPIHTGNREERQYKEEIDIANSGEHCDCCGAYLSTIPWDRTYGLCRKCIADMEKNYGSTQTKLWMFDKEMRPDRAKISLRW